MATAKSDSQGPLSILTVAIKFLPQFVAATLNLSHLFISFDKAIK